MGLFSRILSSKKDLCEKCNKNEATHFIKIAPVKSEMEGTKLCYECSKSSDLGLGFGAMILKIESDS